MSLLHRKVVLMDRKQVFPLLFRVGKQKLACIFHYQMERCMTGRQLFFIIIPGEVFYVVFLFRVSQEDLPPIEGVCQ